jgi:hypothetical protein
MCLIAVEQRSLSEHNGVSRVILDIEGNHGLCIASRRRAYYDTDSWW